MSPHCDDEKKYEVVDAVMKQFQSAHASGAKVAGQAIRDLVTVNGVRVTLLHNSLATMGGNSASNGGAPKTSQMGASPQQVNNQ